MLTAEEEQEIQEMQKEVDMTLIRWMLSLTPLERLTIIQEYAETTWRMRDAQSIQLSENASSSLSASG